MVTQKATDEMLEEAAHVEEEARHHGGRLAVVEGKVAPIEQKRAQTKGRGVQS